MKRSQDKTEESKEINTTLCRSTMEISTASRSVSKDVINQRLQKIDSKIIKLTSILEKKAKLKSSTLLTIPIGKSLKVSDFIHSKPQSSILTNSKSVIIPAHMKSDSMKKDDLNRKCKDALSTNIRHSTIKPQPSIKQVPVKIPSSFLPHRYLRGDLPCTIEHGINGHYLSWMCPMEALDFEFYLPVFFDGLQCKEEPIAFLARQGVEDMLYWGREHPDRIRTCIKELIRPLRNALLKYDEDILLTTLKAIQQLIKSHCGPDLVPYTKQFLTPLTFFLDREMNIGDSIDYGQRKMNCIAEQIRITLEMMEDHGGPKALAAIKFSIPICK